MSDSERHEWVTVAEAAQLLNRSQRTIWRYVADGRLTANRDSSPVLVDIWHEIQDTPSRVPRDSVGELRAEVMRLTAEVDKLTTINDMLTEDRDLWRKAHMAVISDPSRLLEAQVSPVETPEPEQAVVIEAKSPEPTIQSEPEPPARLTRWELLRAFVRGKG